MIRYIPSFILSNFEQQNYFGCFTGYVLFLDIADFTSLCNEFRKEGKKGAEALSCFLTEVLSYPIEQVENFGGFVSLFAGDAFCALFPDGDSVSIKRVIDSISGYFDEHVTIKTAIGSFLAKVRMTVTYGEIDWKIFRNDKQCEYVFYGKPLIEIVELTYQKEPIILSDEVQTTFSKISNTTTLEKHLSYSFSTESERAFIHPRLNIEHPDNEIRDAAYCFADLSRIDEDKREAVLSLIHAKLDDFSGFLNKLDATDKGLVALILFGLPKSAGNTLDRLCRFALEITEAIPELSVGLSCGTAYSGFIGSESTREYTALGTAVNLAARLMQKAEANMILTDNYLQKEMRYKYSFTSDEAISLKGFTTEVHSSRLIDRLLVLSSRYQTSFVGREQEIAHIKSIVLKEGSRIIYVTGEAGAGKSRLILEALKDYPQYYFMFCDPSGHRILEPIKQFLRQYFAIDSLLSNQRNLELFRRQWQKLAGQDKELIRIESIIASLLGFEWEGSVWSVLPPEEKPEQQKNAFATLLNHITINDKLIIHLDDPQWIDNTTLEYLQHLGTKKVQNVTIVAACKDKDDRTPVNLEIPEWEAEQLEINRIDKAASEAIIRQLLQTDTLSNETLDWIVTKADGNPLFLEQAVAYLKENDNFDESFQLKGDFEHISSFGIGDIIGSRIDNLTENVRHTLQHACVLGLEFNTRILSEMLSRKLDDDLGAGKQAKVWADIDELRYIFTHILIKDTAYNRMINEKLKHLHLLAAETMEKLYQDDENALNEHAEEIAIHFHKAEDEITAAKYYDIAGVYFTKICKFDDAERTLQFGLEIRAILFGEEHTHTVESLSNLALLYKYRGDFEQAEPLFTRAFKISCKVFGDEHSKTAMAMVRLAAVYDDQGKYEKSESLLVKSLDILNNTVGAEHLDTSECLNNLAFVYDEQGKYSQAEPIYQKSLSIREKELGTEHPETVITLNNLATMYLTMGSYKQAEPILQRSLAICEKNMGLEHFSTARALNNLASLYYNQGLYRQAEVFFQKSLTILEKVLGTEHQDTVTLINNLAVLSEVQGNYEKAEHLLVKSLALREKILGSDHPGVAMSLVNLASVYQNHGKYELTESLLHRSLKILEKALGTDHPDLSNPLNNLASVFQHQGKFKQAELLFQRALAIDEKAYGTEHRSTAITLSNLANLYMIQGKYDIAEAMNMRALVIKEKVLGSEHSLTALSLHNLAILYSKQGKYEQAESLYLRALTIREKVLGEEHIETLAELNNLAVFYEKQERFTETEPIYLRVLKIRQKVFGLNHQDTQKTIKALVDTYEKLDQPEKADEYRAMLIDSDKDSL